MFHTTFLLSLQLGCFGCLNKEKKQILSTSCTIENQNEEEESLNKEPALKKEEIVKNEVKMDKAT